MRASTQKRLTFCIFLHTISTSMMTQVIPKVRAPVEGLRVEC